MTLFTRVSLFVLLLCPLTASAQVEQAWLAEMEEMLASDQLEGKPADIAVDIDGNVFVATSAFDSTGVYALARLVKYGPDGSLQWMKDHDGVPNVSDAYRAVALDSGADVYAVGWDHVETDQGVAHRRLIAHKYDGGNGELLWARTYDALDRGETTFANNDYAVDVVIDASDNVYVAGLTNQQGTAFTSDDWILIKYTAGGDELWATTFDASGGTGESTDRVIDMAVDAAGEVFVTGWVDAGFNARFATGKFDADGDTLWTRIYDANPAGSDVPAAIAVDHEGSAFVTGTASFSCDSTCRDYHTVKYSATGDELWAAFYDNGQASLSNDDWATAVGVDASGNAYVTGYSNQDHNYDDYLTIKYTSSGDTVWTRRYDGPASEHDVPYAVAFDSDENVYVTGVTGTGANSSDSEFGTIVYSPDGDSLDFVMKEPITNGSHDYPTATVMDADDNLYVTGYQELFSSAVLLTVKYVPESGTAVTKEPLPTEPDLQNYPNPFRNFTTIRYTVPAGGIFRLTVYDILGRQVTTLVDRPLAPGTYESILDAGRLAAGTYLYVGELNGRTFTRRMVRTR